MNCTGCEEELEYGVILTHDCDRDKHNQRLCRHCLNHWIMTGNFDRMEFISKQNDRSVQK